MNSFKTLRLFAFLLPMMAGSPVLADSIYDNESLDGSVWFSAAPHDRVSVDAHGNISLRKGKQIYVQFLGNTGDVRVVMFHWRNVGHRINVSEYALLVPVTENIYAYHEVDHPGDAPFPGIRGEGQFKIIDSDTAELFRIGTLIDGQASALVTKLTRVARPLEVPVPPTFPLGEWSRLRFLPNGRNPPAMAAQVPETGPQGRLLITKETQRHPGRQEI